MLRLVCLLILLVMHWQGAFLQTLQERKVSLAAHDITIEQTLVKLANAEGINFSYQSDLKALKKRIMLIMNDQPLEQVLSAILENSGLVFQVHNNQVIIAPVLAKARYHLLEGRVCISGTYDPVSYAGLELKNLRKGVIADCNGHFRLDLEERYLSDTIRVSSLNFETLSVPARSLAEKGAHTIFLVQKVYTLPPLQVNDNTGSTCAIGNHKWLRRGALYIDTHGQQTALYMDNRKGIPGRIVRVSYFLSAKGNTSAPFRVRIYECDTVSGKPGSDMLPEIVVVKPNQGKGWFHVNVEKYNLKVPGNGFYVAMEGVFPDDYDIYYDGAEFKGKAEEESTGDDFTEAGLLYGQQLGYTRSSANHTWHFAIDKTWFQLKKGHFDVMISAGIRVKEKKKNWKIFNIFENHENNRVDHKSTLVD